MKYSYLWLKELSRTQKSPKELAELLTMRAFEFEGSKTEGKETQMEFSILPNRGHDALSHFGMAREICACEERKVLLPSTENVFLKTYDDDRQHMLRMNIEIKDKKLCPRYVGAIVENVKVASSPKWIQERLLVCGIRPINNIVDITNYVMLEIGQPLHAFDFEKTTGKVIVRRAKKGEKIKLLDEKLYELDENDLVITDPGKVLALAGVMGGIGSGVTSKTRRIILESANFNPTSIRKTRMRHNLVTESSHRFEREIDPNLAGIGMARAIDLLKKYGGRNVIIAALKDIYPKKIKPWRIRLDADYANNLLGEKIPVRRMKNILENLGINARIAGKFLDCEIPTRRIDLRTQEDLIEEIGRIYGYENIKEQAPSAEVKTPPQNKKRNFENQLRDVLVGLGFSEVMNYSFYGADDIAKCYLKTENHVEVANPLSQDQQYLRWSLIPNILKNLSLNLKNFSDVKIFEIGNKFQSVSGNPKEKSVLGGAISDKSAKDDLFFMLKGKVEALLQKIGYDNQSYKEIRKDFTFWHQTRTAEIALKGEEIGRIGEVNPQVLKKYGIKQRVAIFDIHLSEFLEKIGSSKEKAYHPISKFPIVERDISMFVEKETKFNEIRAKINEAGGNLLKNIELFDSFEKDSRKSLALRLKIGSDSKTLASSEIDAVMKRVILKLEKDLKVQVRRQMIIQ